MNPLNETKPLIKLIDADNVLFNWTRGLNEVLLRMDPGFPILHDEEREDWNQLAQPHADPATLRAAMSSPGLYRDLPLIDGAVEGMYKLAKDDLRTGGQTFICTTPDVLNGTCSSEKMEAIRRHFGSYWLSRVILTADKTLVHGDILLDDKPIVTSVRTPDWQHILFRQPHNRHFNPALVANGWDDVDRTLIHFRESLVPR